MNLFGKEPQEIAMQSLIHDTNAALSALEWRIRLISEWFKENNKNLQECKINLQKPYVLIEYLNSEKNRLEKALDSYYIKFKQDFKS